LQTGKKKYPASIAIILGKFIDQGEPFTTADIFDFIQNTLLSFLYFSFLLFLFFDYAYNGWFVYASGDEGLKGVKSKANANMVRAEPKE